MSTLDVLHERGFVQQVSDEAGLRQAMARGITVYCGFDPTRDSLQVGNLMQCMLLAHLQRAGHRPIVVVGAGTTMVGDPSGKTEMRELLRREQIEQNAASVLAQFGRYIDFSGGRGLIVNNADWLLELGYVEFLRDIGRHFTVNQLLQHETYRERVAGDGLSFIEFNYALLQAYDYLHLYREYGCLLQVGGTDQWFNILAGVELIRRVEGRQAFALVTPLISTASGAKMGKTAAGAIWLDPARTSPYEFYQFWVNTEDPDVARFLKLFTFLPLDQIERLGRLQGAEIREAKQVLAYEVTRLVHGHAAAERARADSRALFGDADADLLSVPTMTVTSEQLRAGVDLVDALVQTGLAGSKTGAKNQLAGGGVYVNGERVERADRPLTLDDLEGGQILLRRGKKEYRRIVVG